MMFIYNLSLLVQLCVLYDFVVCTQKYTHKLGYIAQILLVKFMHNLFSKILIYFGEKRII